MLNIASAPLNHIWYLTASMSLYARYATPANNWEGLFFRYIPQWLYCGDDKIIRGLYEGGDSFYRLQYLAAWVPRILNWSAFIAVHVFMMLCVTAVKKPENREPRRAIEKWGYIERLKTPWLRAAPRFHPKQTEFDD